MAKPGLLAELRRRHVWRVAVAYAVAGWLLVQVATQVFPFFDIPNWAVRLVVILIAAGFPVALALAWIYEITPEGIRRTESVDSPDARPDHERRQIGRKLNAFITGALVVAVVVLGGRLLLGSHPAPVAPTLAADRHVADAAADGSRGPAPSPGPARSAIPVKSIAVLPFENLSSDKETDYFVAGMQELILTQLAGIGDLKVISRSSTRKYASRPEDLKTVGQQLGVATVVEGGVQKIGEQVMINVQLIDTRTDSHLWAHSYRRTLDNVFGVEGEVAAQIAGALRARLSPTQTAGLAAVPTQNQAAFDLFLRAEYQASRGTLNNENEAWKAAIPLYRQAVSLDPDFASAWAGLSVTESLLAWFGGGGDSAASLNEEAAAAARRALALRPELAAAHLAVGYSAYYGRGDYAAALEAFATAATLNPNDAVALAAQAFVQRRQARNDDAIRLLRQATVLDPRNSGLMAELGHTLMIENRYADAEDAYQRALALDPSNRRARAGYANAILFRSGDVARALDLLPAESFPQTRSVLLSYQRRYAEALASLDRVRDSPDRFRVAQGPKSLQQANLYRRQGDTRTALPLFRRALDESVAQLGNQAGINRVFGWLNVASAKLGLGDVQGGLDAVAQGTGIAEASGDHVYAAQFGLSAAALYAQAGRPDLAVPVLAKALGTVGVGLSYAPVLLWIDPDWDPIREDPGFKGLLDRYAASRPATIPGTPAAGASAR